MHYGTTKEFLISRLGGIRTYDYGEGYDQNPPFITYPYGAKFVQSTTLAIVSSSFLASRLAFEPMRSVETVTLGSAGFLA
jgi:hypothetical protein